MAVVGLDDLRDERVTNDVAALELDPTYPLNIAEDTTRVSQP